MENTASGRVSNNASTSSKPASTRNPKPVTAAPSNAPSKPRRQGRKWATNSNEGRRPLHHQHGSDHRVYRRQPQPRPDTGKPMSDGTINPRNADTTRFFRRIHPLPSKRRLLGKPVFFIFARGVPGSLDSKKADSKGLRHFYISRAEAAWIGSLTGATAAWT